MEKLWIFLFIRMFVGHFLSNVRSNTNDYIKYLKNINFSSFYKPLLFMNNGPMQNDTLLEWHRWDETRKRWDTDEMRYRWDETQLRWDTDQIRHGWDELEIRWDTAEMRYRWDEAHKDEMRHSWNKTRMRWHTDGMRHS